MVCVWAAISAAELYRPQTARPSRAAHAFSSESSASRSPRGARVTSPGQRVKLQEVAPPPRTISRAPAISSACVMDSLSPSFKLLVGNAGGAGSSVSEKGAELAMGGEKGTCACPTAIRVQLGDATLPVQESACRVRVCVRITHETHSRCCHALTRSVPSAHPRRLPAVAHAQATPHRLPVMLRRRDDHQLHGATLAGAAVRSGTGWDRLTRGVEPQTPRSIADTTTRVSSSLPLGRPR